MDLTHIPVEYILKAANVVKKIAYLIATIGAAASYRTQVELLAKYEMGTLFSWLIPATIDLLAICAAIGLNIMGLPEKDRKFIFRVMAIAVLVSVTANVMGGHNWVTRAGHAWPVVAYLLAEGIANRIRNYVARVQAAQAAKTSPPVEAPLPPVHATATVGTPPAIASAKKGTAKAAILELAAAKPRPADEVIAAKVGVKPGWVKHVIKNHTTA